MGWEMKSNDLLVGKGILKQKYKIADSVTGVRKPYTCYEVGWAMKSNDLLIGKGSLKQNSNLLTL